MAFKVSSSTLILAPLAIVLAAGPVIEAFAPPVGTAVVRGRGFSSSSCPSSSSSALFLSDDEASFSVSFECRAVVSIVLSGAGTVYCILYVACCMLYAACGLILPWP